MRALRRTPPDRGPLARRCHLRVLLPTSQKNPRHLRVRPRGRPARSRRHGSGLPECSGVRLNVDCIGCGNEDELHSGNRCWPCMLSTTVDRLLSPGNQPSSSALQAIATALKSMKRANSGLTWIQQPHVTALLQQLAATPVITHASLDELPPSPTREYVRSLLVEHAALPRRDELNAPIHRLGRPSPRPDHHPNPSQHHPALQSVAPPTPHEPDG